jgi:ribonuclease III
MKSPDELRRELDSFEQKISYRYLDREHAFQALVHSSFANENPQLRLASNERLEFMGDALLDFIFSVRLYREHPDCPEGEMSRLRALVVCESSLARVAEAIGLGGYLLLGRGEDHNGGRSRPSILADALEAVFGGIYLDGGMQAADHVVQLLMEDQYRSAREGYADADYKTRLQEELQQGGTVHISYKVVESSGPDHARTFHVEVMCDGRSLGSGTGKSKKEAEQDAASNALRGMRDIPGAAVRP